MFYRTKIQYLKRFQFLPGPLKEIFVATSLPIVAIDPVVILIETDGDSGRSEGSSFLITVSFLNSLFDWFWCTFEKMDLIFNSSVSFNEVIFSPR